MHELKLMGIKVAIDDFGTGYSSLNYLKRFPIDTLKIDKSFVADVCKDPHDTAIVRAIINLGHALDVTVIAEGVETKEQLQYLSALECDVVQGFLFSKALSAKAFEELLVEQRRVASGKIYRRLLHFRQSARWYPRINRTSAVAPGQLIPVFWEIVGVLRSAVLSIQHPYQLALSRL